MATTSGISYRVRYAMNTIKQLFPHLKYSEYYCPYYVWLNEWMYEWMKQNIHKLAWADTHEHRYPLSHRSRGSTGFSSDTWSFLLYDMQCDSSPCTSDIRHSLKELQTDTYIECSFVLIPFHPWKCKDWSTQGVSNVLTLDLMEI